MQFKNTGIKRSLPEISQKKEKVVYEGRKNDGQLLNSKTGYLKIVEQYLQNSEGKSLSMYNTLASKLSIKCQGKDNFNDMGTQIYLSHVNSQVILGE